MTAVRDFRQSLGDRAGAAIYNRALRDLPNPSLIWRGIVDPSLKQVRVLRIGNCNWQAIDHGHSWGTPGYPAMLARRMRDEGIALRFTDYFAVKGEDIVPELLSKLAPERPDAIIVQIGSCLLQVLPLQSMGLGVVPLRLNWELGRWSARTHRWVAAPLLQRFGRPFKEPMTAERAASGFGRLTKWIDDTYPGVPWAFLPSNPPIRRGFADPQLSAQDAAIYMQAAGGLGATILDYRAALLRAAVGRESQLYGATGSDLRMAGHEIVADVVDAWLRGEVGLATRTAVATSAA